MLFVDEAYAARDSHEEAVLKATITEPKLQFEEKGQPRFSAENRIHLICATNEARAIVAGARERRYAVTYVADTVQQSNSYFSALMGQINGGGAGAFLHHLLAMDLTGFHPRTGIPQNQALADQQALSLKPAEQILQIMVEERVLPGWKCGPDGEANWAAVQAIRAFGRERDIVASERDIGNLLKGLPKSINLKWGSTGKPKRATGYRFESPLATARRFFPGLTPEVTEADEWTYEAELSAI